MPKRLAMRAMRLCLWLVVAVVSVPSPLAAAEGEIGRLEAQNFIDGGIARTIALIKARGLSREEIAARLRLELKNNFDTQAIASFILGPERTAALSRDQLDRFQHEFEELVVQTYTGRILLVNSKIDPSSTAIDDILKVTEAIPAGSGRVLVRTRINRTAVQWINIDWLMQKRNGRPLILDVIFVGISQAELYRSEFASIIQRQGGVEGLIDVLHKKNVALIQPTR